ncbi:MAG: HAD family hydrolase, partial [Telluria sp.]
MQDKLHANELDGAWLSAYDGLKVLSLDCFDTLLWRKVVSPTDVFFALAQSAAFQKMGLTAPLRAKAETMARRIKWVTTQGSEVSLEEIYRHALPQASEADIHALAAAEVSCEIDYCFVFQPVFALIEQAKALGLKVIVVSDTYFSEVQLKQLLFAALPALEGMIDAVYCSNAHGVSKAEGIWRHLLPQLKVKPEQVLHLGDNIEADFHSPQRFGMRATHFIQQHDAARKILTGRAQVAPQVLPELGYRLPVPSYHHAQIARMPPGDAVATFGYACMGPILYSFADYVLREAQALRAQGVRLKVAFLMRDGFLPSRACSELTGETFGSKLNISRFTAVAATLDSRERVVALLTRVLSREALEPLTRQLLLPPALAARILQAVAASDTREAVFA